MLGEQVMVHPLPLPADEILKDYRFAYQSRQASIIGRREVFSGRAKFGIFGDGKELANLAIARAFRKGDWRSGYYRDQTWMFALGVMSIQEFFAQMYAHADVNAEPQTGGRSMNAHFASRYINPDGSWRDQTEMYNVAADLSPTASQMPRGRTGICVRVVSQRAAFFILIPRQELFLLKNIALPTEVMAITGLYPMWNQSSMRCIR